ALNPLTLVLAVLCAAFTGYLQSKAFIILSALSMVLMGLRFLITVVKQNYEIISFSLLCLLKSLAEHPSAKKAVKVTIAMAVHFYYDRKLSAAAKTVLQVASQFNSIKSSSDIEEKAAKDFYPLVKQYLLQDLLFNTVLWVAAYGMSLGLIKTIIFTNALGMPVWWIIC
ncbi:MAG: hypothetical protein LBB80_05635, partial [Treponema sp.]|nr:hypothetical protein [Treponema sp.]